MASKYARSGGGNWNTDSTWSTTSGGSADTTKPTAADDVFLDGSSGNVTIDAASVCRSINCTSYTGTLLHNAFTLTIGDATAGASNIALKFVTGMTYTLASTTSSAVAFISTSSTQQDVDFAGKTTGNVSFNASSNGSWRFTGQIGTSSNSASQILTLSKGTLAFNGQTAYCGVFNSNNSNVRTLTLDTGTLNVLGTGIVINFSTENNLTVTSASGSTINLLGSAAVIYMASNKTYGTVNFTGGGACGFNYQGNTYTAIVYTGTASKTCSLYFNTANTITTNFQINGNSAANRVLVYSDSFGTARAITLGASATCASTSTNVDFRDITLSGGATNERDLSGITGGSGDCCGNSGITFTTADDWYWNGSDNPCNFSDYDHWYTATNGGGSQMGSTRCPLPQDTCYFDSSSIDGTTVVDQDMARIGGVDFTGCSSMTMHFDNLDQEVYGSLIFVSNVAMAEGSNAINFRGRSSYTFTPSTHSYGGRHSLGVAVPGGTLTMGGPFTQSASGNAWRNVTHSHGTLDLNDYNHSFISYNGSASSTRTLSLGNGNITLTAGNATNTWDFTTSTNLTFNAEGSTIVLGAFYNNGSATFVFGGKTYNNLTINASTAGTETVFITGSNTWATVSITGRREVNIAASATQTITTLSVTSTKAAPVIIHSSTTTNTTLSLTNACSLTNTGLSHVTGAGTGAITFGSGCYGNGNTSVTGYSTAVNLERTVMPSSGDFTTLASCLLAYKQNLTLMEVYFDVKIDGTWSSEDTSAVTLSGYTLSNTYYMNIYTTTSARHQGVLSTSYYMLKPSSGALFTFSVNSSPGTTINNVFIKGIQFDCSGGGNGISMGQYCGGITVAYCIFKGSATSGNGVNANDMRGTNYFYNNVAYNFLSTYGTAFEIGGTQGTILAYNNTIYDCKRGLGFYQATGGTVKAKNNLIMKHYTGDNGCFYWISRCDEGTNNATSDSTGDDSPLTNGIVDKTTYSDYFESVTAGSEDFHLKSTATDFINAGADLSGESLFTDDILGNTRSTWDIGAFEYVSAGVTVTVTAVALTLSAPDVVVVTVQNVTVTATAVALTLSVPPDIAVKGGALVNLTDHAVNLSLTAPNVTVATAGNITVQVTAVALSLSAPDVSVTAVQNVTVSVSAVALTLSAPDVVVATIQNVTIQATAVALTITAPSVTVTTVETTVVTVSVVEMNLSAPSVVTTQGAVVGVSVVPLTMSSGSPTMVTGAVVQVTPISLELSALTVTILGTNEIVYASVVELALTAPEVVVIFYREVVNLKSKITSSATAGSGISQTVNLKSVIDR